MKTRVDYLEEVNVLKKLRNEAKKRKVSLATIIREKTNA